MYVTRLAPDAGALMMPEQGLPCLARNQHVNLLMHLLHTYHKLMRFCHGL